MKLIYLVLDGAADRLNGPTPLEEAETEGLDELCRYAKCGLQYSIGEGIAPESDVAVFSILGYNPQKENYPGRGPIEALGVGVELRGGKEVAFRGNFATVDPESMEIIDRRSGRDISTQEARELSEVLNNIKFDVEDAYVKVIPTYKYRNVVIFGCESGLSDKITHTDPAYKLENKISMVVRSFRHKIKSSVALDGSEEAERTAHLVNYFTMESIRLLNRHPINLKREREGKLKANAILLRQPGTLISKIKRIDEKFGLRFGSITEMPVERGVAKLLRMKAGEVPPPSSNIPHDLKLRIEALDKLLRDVDIVYVHLKGPDIPGHDGNFSGKVRSIELIDKFFISEALERWDLDEVSYLVTSDHATPWRLKAHSGDPVPFMVASKKIEPDGIRKFCERECYKGSLGKIDHGWLLLPKVINLIFKQS